jgi:mannose-6-phosphate isomerase-like protein (cupin superfamily)
MRLKSRELVLATRIFMTAHDIAPLLVGNTIASNSDGFVIAEWKDAGGHAGERRLIAPVHLHHHDDEAWYVLEGRLCVQVGDKDVEARARAVVLVSRCTPHTYWNPGPEPVRYLLVMTSNTHRLIQAIHATSDRSRATLQEIFRRHGSELL